MRIVCLLFMTVLFTGVGGGLPAQERTSPKKSIYHDGWIDLNKNGRMDVYEDPKAPIDKRIDDLLAQMTLEEKTCQTATLYGVGRGRTGAEPPLKVEPGMFKVMIGSSSEDIRLKGEFEILKN